MKFTKMHGLGNDYIYLYAPEGVPQEAPELSIRLSDRHKSIGSDGIIYITSSPNPEADFMMRIFNADGSEAKMCGNGIRCVGKYVLDHGLTDKKVLKIDTLSGIKILNVLEGPMEEGTSSDRETWLTVDMGQAKIEKPHELAETSRTVIPVSTGNPHVVIFVEDMDQVDLAVEGEKIAYHDDFPGGVNVEYVQVLSPTHLRMRVYERGSGITMACGTGSCASTVAAVTQGFCPYNENIRITLDGGDLYDRVTEDLRVFMTGPAEEAYEGEVIV